MVSIEIFVSLCNSTIRFICSTLKRISDNLIMESTSTFVSLYNNKKSFT